MKALIKTIIIIKINVYSFFSNLPPFNQQKNKKSTHLGKPFGFIKRFVLSVITNCMLSKSGFFSFYAIKLNGYRLM